MRFKGLDLNLLVAFDILVEERSVSRAAKRLQLSQPAMSAALGRLRSYFDDPILGARGKCRIPTAHAMRLHPMVRETLSSIETMMSVSSVFDPATTHRHFRIGISDHLAAVIFSKLSPALEAEAPLSTIELIAPSPSMLDRGDLDILITPEEHASPDHPAELLLEETYVVAGCLENPLFAHGLTEADFLEAGHVAVDIGRENRISLAETRLQLFSAKRRIEVTVPSYLLAPEMVINTRRLTVIHRRLAKALSKRMPIAFAALPFEGPAMREMIQFHRARDSDKGLLWLRERIKYAADDH